MLALGALPYPKQYLSLAISSLAGLQAFLLCAMNVYLPISVKIDPQHVSVNYPHVLNAIAQAEKHSDLGPVNDDDVETALDTQALL
jgi:hypothetical protein